MGVQATHMSYYGGEQTSYKELTLSQVPYEHGLLVDGSLRVCVLCTRDVQVLELQCKPAERYSVDSSIGLTEVEQVMGPQHYSAMSNRLGVAKRVFVGDDYHQETIH